MVITEKVVITDRLGLHLRAAAELVRTASKFKSKIDITKNNRTVNAKSLMNLIALEATYGSELTLTIEGEDALAASREILGLFKSRFNEPEKVSA